MGADGDRLEGGQRKGGSNGRKSGIGGGAGVDGLGLGAQGRHTGGDRVRHRGGGVPGSKGLQWSGAEWSGVERSGAEWSGVERSGAGRRINSLGGDLKQGQRSIFKYIKGQSLESNIAADLGLEHHHPIMSNLWGLGDQTYRQTDSCMIKKYLFP